MPKGTVNFPRHGEAKCYKKCMKEGKQRRLLVSKVSLFGRDAAGSRPHTAQLLLLLLLMCVQSKSRCKPITQLTITSAMCRSPSLGSLSPMQLAPLSLLLALVLLHQPLPASAASSLDLGQGYPALSPRSDEANAAAYARKYGSYGRRAAAADDGGQWADYGLDAPQPLRFQGAVAQQQQKIDIHVVAHTHDDVGWLSTVFA